MRYGGLGQKGREKGGWEGVGNFRTAMKPFLCKLIHTHEHTQHDTYIDSTHTDLARLLFTATGGGRGQYGRTRS